MTKKERREELRLRMIRQASMCVQDLVKSTEKEGNKPWIDIIYGHMDALFKKPENKSQ